MMLRKLDVHEIDALGPLETLEVGKTFGSGTEITVKRQRIPFKRVGATCDYVRRQIKGILSPDMIIATVRHDGDVYAVTLGDLFNLHTE